MDADERRHRIHAAHAHLEAAVEKLRAELEAQAHGRCRLTEDRVGDADGEARRAYESYRSVDWEAGWHVSLARQALCLNPQEDAVGGGGDRWDDLPPEEILEEARRRRIAQDRAFALKTSTLEDLEGLDGFDPDAFKRGGTGG